jgi:hypothetical protein
MFEHRRQPLLPTTAFIRRAMRFAGFGLVIVAFSLLIGILGYHFFEGLSWLDAFVNASMILGGMGPVNPLQTIAGKVFAGCYALFSGIVFLIAVAVILSPLIHRILHRFHLEIGEGGDGE